MLESKALNGLPPDARSKARKVRQPTWIAPMLATLTVDRFSRPGWIFEPKLDGERCLVFRRGARVELYSRNQKLLNMQYPELVEAFHRQKMESFVVDGEIVTLVGKVSNFAKLQHRMQVRQPSAELRRKVPVCFYAFDLLYLDSFDVRQVSLRFRRSLLQHALLFDGPLRLVDQEEEKGEAYYRKACDLHLEGVIAKNVDSPYLSGRSLQWLKFKCVNEQELVIAGYTNPQGERIGFGALLLGYYERGKLKYAGKVGTGFNDATLRRLRKELSRLEVLNSPIEGDRPSPAGVHWVKPKLVAQIGFTEWTDDGKLRHPRFLGLRDDKSAEEVRREK